jgi:hypothetical protein
MSLGGVDITCSLDDISTFIWAQHRYRGDLQRQMPAACMEGCDNIDVIETPGDSH